MSDDDYDPDDHGYSFEEVCDRLDNIEAAVKDSHPGLSWVWLVVVGSLAVLGFADMWNSKTRYALWYGVTNDKVTLEKKPTDCNFFRSPMGDKDCHYDRQVNIIKVDNSNAWGGQSISYDNGETWVHTAKNSYGIPIVSRDGGTTWSTESVPARTEPQIIVSWEKKDDN
jgi:hypothetical protein